MKYQQRTFTLPVSSNKVTQEDWDRIFPDDKEDACVLLPEVLTKSAVGKAEECVHETVVQEE